MFILILRTPSLHLQRISGQVAILISWGRSRKQQKIPNMLRVLLRIDTIRLKVREEVELHIVVRKDHHHFTHARGQLLRNGQATLTQSSEFLLDGNSPKFDLEVFLIAGETRKRGGVASINLRAFAVNASHRVVLPLRKTPLTDSSLSVDFVYMFAQGCPGSGGVISPLVSLQRAEQQEHRQHLKLITAEHQKLIFHNSRLSQQIKRLKQRNQDLSNQRRSLEQTITKKEEQYSSEMQRMERQREISLSQLQSERRKIEMIVEKIASSGDLELKMEMDRMINQGHKSDTPTTTTSTGAES